MWCALRLPWLDGDSGIPSMWEYGYHVTDEGYYLVGGKEKMVWDRFVELPRAETATYGYAPGMHYLSLAAHKMFGLSTWKWRIPFVFINFIAWIVLFFVLARRTRPWEAFAVCAAFSLVPMIVVYERTASNDVLIGSLLVLSCAAALGRGLWRLVLSAFLITPVVLIKPSLWALLPLVVCAALSDSKTRSKLLDAGIFLGAFLVAFLLTKVLVYVVTMPEAAANGVSVGEVMERMNARYPLPDMLDILNHLKGLSSFPRDPSCTILGPLTILLVPLPLFFLVRRFEWGTLFGFFIAAYVGAVSIMNTIYTHYFIPTIMALPVFWALVRPHLDEFCADSREKLPLFGLLSGVAVALAAVLYVALTPLSFDPAVQHVYSRVYNLPSNNVWTVSGLKSVAFAVAVAAICALFAYRRLKWRGVLAAGLAAGFVGSVSFAILPAVGLASRIRVPLDAYLMPLVVAVAFGIWLIAALSLFPSHLRKLWCLVPAFAVLVAYVAIPAWRSSARELVSPPTHFHREAAETLRKLLPDDAIVIGERSDQMLMSLPIKTSSTFLANSDGTLVADALLKENPQAKLYLLADSQHAYNLQNFEKRKDKYGLEMVHKFSMPSFGSGRPADVYLCKIIERK